MRMGKALETLPGAALGPSLHLPQAGWECELLPEERLPCLSPLWSFRQLWPLGVSMTEFCWSNRWPTPSHLGPGGTSLNKLVWAEE